MLEVKLKKILETHNVINIGRFSTLFIQNGKQWTPDYDRPALDTNIGDARVVTHTSNHV